MSTAYEIVRALYSLEMPCNGLLLWVVSLTFGRSSMRPTIGFFCPLPKPPPSPLGLNSPSKHSRTKALRPPTLPYKKRCGDQPLMVTASKSGETAKHRPNSDSITLQRKASSQSEDAFQYARAQCGAKEQGLINFYRFIYLNNHADR